MLANALEQPAHGALFEVACSVSWLVTRPEKADDLLQRADANLNVIQLTKSSAVKQFAALDEKSAHRVKCRFALVLAKLVERLHHCAIQIPRPEFQAAIPGDRRTSFGTDSPVRTVGNPDLVERLHIGQIETVPQVNHRPQHGGMPDAAAPLFAFRFGPATWPSVPRCPPKNNSRGPASPTDYGSNAMSLSVR